MDHEIGNKVSWAVGIKKVLCVGVAVLDCISEVRKFPNDSSRSRRAHKSEYRMGGRMPTTCAVLANLGVSVELLAMLSTSSVCSVMMKELRRRGISIEHCPRCDLSPQFAMVVLSKSPKTCTILECNTSFPYVTVSDFQKIDLNQYGWIHFLRRKADDTLQMMQIVAAHNATHEEKIVISMDLIKRVDSNYPLVDYCHYVFYSRNLARENGWQTQEEACSKIDQQFTMRSDNNLNRPVVILQWDLQTGSVINENGTFFSAQFRAPPRIVEALGAERVFFAAFIYAIYARNRSREVALDFAHRLVYQKCTKKGFDHLVDILTGPNM